jgi:hypothetical protein
MSDVCPVIVALLHALSGEASRIVIIEWSVVTFAEEIRSVQYFARRVL